MKKDFSLTLHRQAHLQLRVFSRFFSFLLQLTFSDFDIEAHENCAWDSVTVRNGGSPGSPIIGHYCGILNPGTIQSGSNQLVVIFNTDHSIQHGHGNSSLGTIVCTLLLGASYVTNDTVLRP